MDLSPALFSLDVSSVEQGSREEGRKEAYAYGMWYAQQRRQDSSFANGHNIALFLLPRPALFRETRSVIAQVDFKEGESFSNSRSRVATYTIRQRLTQTVLLSVDSSPNALAPLLDAPVQQPVERQEWICTTRDSKGCEWEIRCRMHASPHRNALTDLYVVWPLAEDDDTDAGAAAQMLACDRGVRRLRGLLVSLLLSSSSFSNPPLLSPPLPCFQCPLFPLHSLHHPRLQV